MVDYIQRWTERVELPVIQLFAWLELSTSKFHQWKDHYGKANEHNDWVARHWWLGDSEK